MEELSTSGSSGSSSSGDSFDKLPLPYKREIYTSKHGVVDFNIYEGQNPVRKENTIA